MGEETGELEKLVVDRKGQPRVRITMHLTRHYVVADSSEGRLENQLLLAHAHLFEDVVFAAIRHLTRRTLPRPQRLRIFNISEHLTRQIEALDCRSQRAVRLVDHAVFATRVVCVGFVDRVDILLREAPLRLLHRAILPIADGFQILDAS